MNDNHNPADQPLHLKESLSAFMDGAANGQEAERVLEHLATDDDLRQSAHNYQLIGDVVRDGSGIFSQMDISKSVSAAIENEPAHKHAIPSRIPAKNDRTFSKMAIAASFTLAVITGTGYLNLFKTDKTLEQQLSQEHSYPLSLQNGDSVTSVSPPFRAEKETGTNIHPAVVSARRDGLTTSSADTNETSGPDSKANRKLMRDTLNAYVLQHAHHVAIYQGQSILPFARMATSDLLPAYQE